MTAAATASREALEAARRELEGGGSSIGDRLALAEACFRLAVLPDSSVEAGIDLLRQAAAADPYHPKFFFHLGRLLHKNGDPQEAVLQYRRGLRLAPRSHRTLLHLALALKDLGVEDQALGLSILEALHAGDDGRLAALVADLDKLIARRLGDKAGEAAKSAAATTASEPGKCRWPGIWKLLVLGEMTKPKPALKVAGQRMDEGKRLIQGAQGAAEYALAGLFFILDAPKTCRQLEGWLRDPALAAQKDRPALQLLRSACELGAAGTLNEFVKLASERLTAGLLPTELVCCLHYCWYGTAANADVLKAVEALDAYPEPFRSSIGFRELRVAILDHHARQAWSAERIDRAEILWQETLRYDPFRIPVAHNLAIAATQSKATEKYAAAWDRAAEVRYLEAAAAGDVRVGVEDRIRLHRSFAQQSKLRYLTEKPDDEQLRTWMKDRDALRVWLREAELMSLNSRLKFRSPVSLLGIPKDCSPEDAESARSSLCRQFALCFRGRQWAGGRVFLRLVETLAELACEAARDSLTRKRDIHAETEQPEAEELGMETVNRGLLMFDMVKLAAGSKDLKPAGLEVASFLLAMPWRALEALAKRRMGLSADTDLVPVFVSYVMGVALPDKNEKLGAREAADRLSAVEGCILSIPDSLDLHLVRCRLLLELKRNRDAYQAAIEALPKIAGLSDRKEAAALQSQFVICMDNAAMDEIPDGLLPAAPDKVRETVNRCRKVLDDFPSSGGLRFLIANLLIKSAGAEPSRAKEAAALLEEGLPFLQTEEQIAEAHKLLKQAGSHGRSFDAFKQIRELLEAAAVLVREATAAVKEERTPANVRQAKSALEEALARAAQAEEIGVEAELANAVEKAREFAANVRKILAELERG